MTLRYTLTRIAHLYFLAVLFVSCNSTEPTNGHFHFPAGLEVDTIPFRFGENNHILVAVTIEGQRYDFVFDSGAARTTTRHGIPFRKVDQDTAYLIDAYGQAYNASFVSLDTLRIGKLAISDLSQVFQTAMDIDGIIGGDILRHLAWKIDFAKRHIYAAKTSTLFGVDHRDGMYFRLRENSPYTTCHIDGTAIETLIDTGNSDLLTINNRHLTDRFSMLTDRITSWFVRPRKSNPFTDYAAGFSERTTVDTVSFIESKVALGGHVLDGEVVDFGPCRPSAFLGLDLLKRFDYLILDYPKRKLHLGNPRHQSLQHLDMVVTRLNTMGIHISHDSIPLVVGIASFMANSGVHIGDTIIAVDTTSFANRGADFYKQSLTDKLTSPAPHKLAIDQFHLRNDSAVLTLKRGDQTQQVNLTRRFPVESMPDTVLHIAESLSHPGYYIRSSKPVNDHSGSYYVVETRKWPLHDD